MQLIAITELSVEGISWQRFEKKGLLKKTSIKHIGMIRWEEIQRASVFKRDLFSYDLICLELALGTGEVFELDEEDSYWSALTEAMPQFLPGCKPWSDWFGEVAFPAFETNEQRIFKR